MEQNRQAQEEALRVREELIRDLEEAREAARREREENAGLKAARKQELEAQVGAGGAGSIWEDPISVSLLVITLPLLVAGAPGSLPSAPSRPSLCPQGWRYHCTGPGALLAKEGP